MAQGSITNHYELLIIGGSAGSLEVLLQLLPVFRKDMNISIVIVLHRKAGESLLVDVLTDKTQWKVKEAEEKERIEKQTVYIAPSDYHLLIEEDKTFSLDYSEKIHHSRPSIDVSFEMAAEVFGASTIGVLLSGANADGAEGLRQIKKAGGVIIAQDPEEATVGYMPRQAILQANVDYIAGTKEISEIVNRLTQ